jgi:peptide-methionine (R)-S-oxide reductase
MNRRVLLKVLFAGYVSSGYTSRLVSAATVPSSTDKEVTIATFAPSGKGTGTVRLPKILKSDDAWRSQLSALAYRVARCGDTELAFTGAYAESHEDGLYRCVCCETALFDSRTKYDSGTGWPSFWQPISLLNVEKLFDSSHGLRRDAIRCRLCDAHLGHVFDDGPQPTGLRYCINSVSLHFNSRA